MKYILLSGSLLLAAQFSYCQPINNDLHIRLPLTDNRIVYTQTVTLGNSFSKELLFHNAQEWYRHNFESNDNTFIINNIDLGKISGTGIIHTRKRKRGNNPGDLHFNVAITVDKGVYQYKVDSIYGLEDTVKFYYSDMYSEELYPPAKPRWPENYRQNMLADMNDRLSAMIEKMKSDMKRE